jgi:hypothetical protein
MQIPEIQIASVKVMRSHDYCHFEVCLSSSAATTPEAVDELRKTAARLADKAVNQYKVAKENVELALNDKSKLESLRYRHRDVMDKPEAERTPEEKALVKAIGDRAHFNRRQYDYEDEWGEEPSGPDEDSMF